MDKIYEIKSLKNPYLKKILKLKDKKGREKEGKFLVEGYHMVREAYSSKCLLSVLTVKETSEFHNVDVISASNAVIEKISDTKTPQGIIGICQMPEESKNILYGNRILLLDNLTDPGNLGTLIRSALGFNFKTVILSKNSVDVYNDKVLRATQGAFFKVNVSYRDLTLVLAKLKEKGIKIVAADAHGGMFLRDVKPLEKCAVLLGNETRGINKDLLRSADFVARIDTEKELESLNVAVAGAIIMRHLYINHK